MQKKVAIALSSILIALTACIQDGQKTSGSGPCIGTLCLGTDSADKVTTCTDNLSNSSIVSIKACSVKEQISLSGVMSKSIEATIVNDKLGKARLVFDKSACELIFSTLSEKFGKVATNRRNFEYEELYRKFGYSPPAVSLLGFGEGWKTENGFLFLTGAGLSGSPLLDTSNSCTLQLDSDWANNELKKAVKIASESSISG